MNTKRYLVVDLDIWGNDDEGYMVNNCHGAGIINIPVAQTSRLARLIAPVIFNKGTGRECRIDSPTDRQVLDSMIKEGLLVEDNTLENIEIKGNDRLLTVNDKMTGRPLYNLIMCKKRFSLKAV